MIYNGVMLFSLLSNLVMYLYLMLVQDLVTITAEESVFFKIFPENRPIVHITDRFLPYIYQKTDHIHTKPTTISQKTDRLHYQTVGYKSVGYANHDSPLPQTRPRHNRPLITDRGRI